MGLLVLFQAREKKEKEGRRMVLLLLQIKADLENVTNLEAKGGSDGSEFTFFFKVVVLFLLLSNHFPHPRNAFPEF